MPASGLRTPSEAPGLALYPAPSKATAAPSSVPRRPLQGRAALAHCSDGYRRPQVLGPRPVASTGCPSAVGVAGVALRPALWPLSVHLGPILAALFRAHCGPHVAAGVRRADVGPPRV